MSVMAPAASTVSTTAAAEAESSVMLMKPGPATSTLAMPSASASAAANGLGQIARLHAGLLGQLHGDVGGPVAMRAVLRAHHGELVDGRNQLVGQRAILAGGDEVVGNAGNQFT